MSSDSRVKVGARVSLPGGGEAYVRFVGEVRNKEGVFAGVELIGDAVSKGKNSGDVDGVSYFKTKLPRTGLFLPYHKLLHANGVPPSVNNRLTTPLRPLSPLSVRGNSPVVGLSKKQTAGNEQTEQMACQITELTQQNRDYRAKLDRYQQQLAERSRILEDLQATVESFESILEESQRELRQKDVRFEKYKENTDLQIKELIDAVETLEQQANENESLYLQRLQQLKEQQQTRPDADEEAAEAQLLRTQLQEKEQQIKDLKTAQRKEIDQARVLETDNYKLSTKVEQLEEQLSKRDQGSSELEELRKRCESLERVSAERDEGQKKAKELEQKVAELEAEIERLKTATNTEKAINDDVLGENGELKVFEPAVKSDPAAGRAKWCGLCERQGHESVDCPYENMIF